MPKSPLREGAATGLLRWADHAVVEGRFYVALAIIGGLVGDFIGVVVDPYFPAVSGIELALAIGTLALAYSATLQAVVALQKRRDDLLPHLDLQILEKAEGLPGLLRPTGVDSFFLGPDRSSIYARVRNLGPGNAMGVRLTLGEWWQRTDLSDEELIRQATGEKTSRAPIYDPPHGYGLVMNAPFSLRANEDYPFDIQFRVPPNLPDPGSPRASYIFLLQAVIVASSQDVEGNPADAVRMGLLLQRAISAHPSGLPDSASGLAYRTFWRRLTDEEVGRVSFAPPV